MNKKAGNFVKHRPLNQTAGLERTFAAELISRTMVVQIDSDVMLVKYASVESGIGDLEGHWQISQPIHTAP